MKVTDLNLEMKGRGVKVVIEESIPQLVSGFGRYQLFQCTLIVIPIIFASMSNTNFVFAAAATKYRCSISQCGSTGVLHSLGDSSNFSNYKCTRPVFADNSTCNPDDVIGTVPCAEWIYENNDSVVSELPCLEFKRTLIGTIHNLGVLVGMPLTGFISDRWGRRVAIILNGFTLIVGALKSLTGPGGSGYIQYVVVEFFEALLVTGAYTSCFVLLVELIGSEKRIIAAAILGISINLGDILLSCIVWNVSYWRHFVLFLYLPGALFLIYALFLNESMRWLLTNGKKEEAVNLLDKIAKWNGVVVPAKMRDLDLITSSIDVAPEEKYNIKLLFKSPLLLRRLLVCGWWWFSVALVYYGLTFSSVSLPGNKITNFALSGMISIPGELVAVLVLNRIGRKKTLIGGYVICGLCCIGIGFIPKDYNAVQLTIFLIGKMSITTCFNVVYVYTSELMPTSARASLLSTCSMVARIGSVLSPLTLLLAEKKAVLPSLLFGCVSISAALIALTTPETLHRQLPDTIAQAISLT